MIVATGKYVLTITKKCETFSQADEFLSKMVAETHAENISDEMSQHVGRDGKLIYSKDLGSDGVMEMTIETKSEAV